MSLKVLSDNDLWLAVIQDDKGSFTELYNRYWSTLYQSANRFLNDKELAEQVLHDVFVILWQRRKHLTIHSFPQYIHAATRYHVYKILKSQKSSPIIYIDAYNEANHEVSSLYNDAEERLATVDLNKELKVCLNNLPKRCQQIFYMSRMDHLSNNEIAEQLGISKRSVENQLTFALKYLRKVLPEIGIKI